QLSITFRFVCTLGAFLGTSLLGAAQTAPSAQPPLFEQSLRAARYELHLENGRLTGAAAPVLKSAISEAHYVLIGEDHITREIPQFTAAICNLLGAGEFSTMVVEASPEAASFVSSSLGKSGRLERMAALIHQYPDSVAFLNIRQENDLVQHCAQAAHNAKFKVWGLDQPFIGSAGWLLDQILATHPGPDATALLKRFK